MKPNQNQLVTGIAILVFSLIVLACNRPVNNPPEERLMSTPPPPDPKTVIERGKYLVNIGLCHDCHSPKVFTDQGPEPDGTRLLSGNPADMLFKNFDPALVNEGLVLMNPHFTAFAGPWGVSYAANLTPDATGLGSWNEENFLRAMREGKYKGLTNSRDLLPPMPWHYYRLMSDEDILAIFAYLKTLKPVRNIVPAPGSFTAG